MPDRCPPFGYERDRPRLVQQTTQALEDLRTGALGDTLAMAKDSRPVHASLFAGLTPAGFEYYAGNYRGEAYECLRDCVVFAGGQPTCPPHLVLSTMAAFAADIERAVKEVDAIPNEKLNTKLAQAIRLAAMVFDRFLRIHPYRDGNGHGARFLVWAVLGRYDHWPVRFTVEPRPDQPPPAPSYMEMIFEYRRGNKQPLEKYFVECLKPPPAPPPQQPAPAPQAQVPSTPPASP